MFALEGTIILLLPSGRRAVRFLVLDLLGFDGFTPHVEWRPVFYGKEQPPLRCFRAPRDDSAPTQQAHQIGRQLHCHAADRKNFLAAQRTQKSGYQVPLPRSRDLPPFISQPDGHRLEITTYDSLDLAKERRIIAALVSRARERLDGIVLAGSRTTQAKPDHVGVILHGEYSHWIVPSARVVKLPANARGHGSVAAKLIPLARMRRRPAAALHRDWLAAATFMRTRGLAATKIDRRSPTRTIGPRRSPLQRAKC